MALTDDISVRDGALYGGIAWLVGLVVVFALTQLAGNSLAMFTSLFPIAGAAFGYMLLHGWLVFSNPMMLIFTIIPIVILILFGYKAAQVSAGSGARGSGFQLGASIAIGYFALVILSIVFVVVRAMSLMNSMGVSSSTTTAGSGGNVDPVMTIAILGITGIVFPVVFGGLGGWAADR